MDLKTLGNIVGVIVGVATTAVPVLFSLRPSKVSLGDDVCAALAAGIGLAPHVQSVDLRNNRISKLGCAPLARALCGNTQLRSPPVTPTCNVDNP